MKNFSFSLFPSFLRSLVYGYAFVILLLIIACVGFIQYAQYLKNELKQTETLYQQQSLIDQHMQLARERSAILVKMLNTSDIFDLDALQQQMFDLEHQIGKVRQTLKHSLHLSHEQALLDKTFPLIKANKHAQETVFRLLINDQKEQAIKELTETTLPTQERVFSALTQLKKDLAERLDQQKARFNQTIALMDKLVFLSAAIPILAILIIGFVTTRRIYQQEKRQQAFQSELEAALQKRTQELQLDASVFQQINEVIAVGDTEGNLIKMNALFQNLIKQTKLSTSHTHHTLWHLLQTLFDLKPIFEIRKEVTKKGFWRTEVKLKGQEQYFILTLSTIQTPLEKEIYISAVLSDITEIKFFQHKLEQLATTDAVTGLHNRHALNQYLQTTLSENNQPFTLFNLDLDHFKAINDHLGHDEGDRLLQTIAQILIEIFKSQKTRAICCRVGGDEFVICIPKTLTKSETSQYCEQLLQQVSHLSRQWKKLGFGVSVGIARFPEHGKTAQDILRHADYAMYHAKQTGKNHYVIFDESLHKQIIQIQTMENRIKTALEVKDFKVYFQPQVNLKTLQLCGAEALLRWPTEEGMIPPTEFIPLAEKFNLINELGNFVLNEAVETFCQWQQRSEALPRIAINVSAIQISTSQLGPAVKQVLTRYPVHPNQIDFEITESVLMDSTQNRYPCLSFLENLGSEISIDDFGTGYSSLAYIQNIKADRIKIDRSFVQAMEPMNTAYNIVKAIIQMAHSLGLKVLAEGIETQEQLLLLQELGCDEGQGFFFNQALSAQEFEQVYLQQSPPKQIIVAS